MPNEMLKYVGKLICSYREQRDLTQHELAEQTGCGLRYLQNIEAGDANPSYKVLASLVTRLAIPPYFLFYRDAAGEDQVLQHLLGKIMACTEDERQIILNTLDCMAEEFISRYQK